MLIKDLDNSRQSCDVSSDFFIVQGTASAIVKSKEILALIVDEPCLKACEYLYDCNVLTTGSSANGTNFNKHGEITIKYSSLNDKNKEIYKRLVSLGVAKVVEKYDIETKSFTYNVEETDAFHLIVPMDETTTDDDFSNKMETIARQFQPQDILYGNYTSMQMFDLMMELIEKKRVTPLGQLIEDYMVKEVEKGNISIDEEGYWDLNQTVTIFNNISCEYYYDSEEDKYWIDESLYHKHIDFVGKRKNL